MVLMSQRNLLTNKMDLESLASKPSSYKFNKKELKFIRKKIDFSRYKIHYCIYPNKSPQNKYVGFFVDSMSHNPRGRKPHHYSMKVICSRALNEKEIMWEVENYGSTNRRFVGFWFTSILSVIDMDRQYGVETPKEFIDICNKKGYTKGLQQTLKFD